MCEKCRADGRLDITLSMNPIERSALRLLMRHAALQGEKDKAFKEVSAILRPVMSQLYAQMRQHRIDSGDLVHSLERREDALPLYVHFRRQQYKTPSEDHFRRYVADDVVEALDGCDVEPDGTCPHGFPSWLIAAGVI